MKLGKMRSLLGREGEGEKMTKVHDYPKGGKNLQSNMSVVRWKDVGLFLLTLAICSTTLNTSIC